ncbi:MAG TPA: DUF1573 domain-containing protein [Chitinophagaceae bacterium]
MKSILCLLITVLSLAACQTADKKISATDLTTIEWIDSTFIDLGEIKAGSEVEIPFLFKNTGDKQLVIASVTAGCGCTVAEKPEQPIAPGQDGLIIAKFNSKGQPKGEARKSVRVTANTDPAETTLEFRVAITD